MLKKQIFLLIFMCIVPTYLYAANGALQLHNGSLSLPDGTVLTTAPKDGKSVLNGSGAPSVVANIGDFYIDTTNSRLYGPYIGSWGSGVSLVGPPGIQGPKGDTGATGPQGQGGTGQVTLISMCDAISVGGVSSLPNFCQLSSSNVITDPATNLSWQKGDDGLKRNWYDATNYCSTTSFGGLTGWRLPSMTELQALNKSSIYAQIIGTHMAQINGTWIGSYWSNTSYDSTQAYHVFLTSGSGSGYADKNYYSNLVRCVRP
jgi:hypothetical protein